MHAIELQGVDKIYGSGIGQVKALSDINFVADRGAVNLVIGPSGSGKSTFLTIAGGLQSPSHGQVLVEGRDVSGLSRRRQESLRLNHIGFVLQSYDLLPYLTVADQFKLADRVKPTGNMSRDELTDLLAELGISSLMDKYSGNLSGGQNQRVAIARALYTKPSIVLADEPTAALDSARVKDVGKLFWQLAHQHNEAVIVVTHDERLKQFADHIYQIIDGQMTMASDETTTI